MKLRKLAPETCAVYKLSDPTKVRQKMVLFTEFSQSECFFLFPDPSVVGHGHLEPERRGDQGRGQRHLPGDDLDLAQLCQKNVLLARLLRVL